MSYIYPMRLGQFLTQFNCILCQSPIKDISAGDLDDSIELAETGLHFISNEIYYNPELSTEYDPSVPPKAFHYSRREVRHFLSYGTCVNPPLNDIEVLKLRYKSFWIEFKCTDCKKYSLGAVLDYNCDDESPKIWAEVQDQQLILSGFFIKNYFNNVEYTIVVNQNQPSGPVRIQRVDFNQPENDILNEVKIQLAFT